MKTEWPDGLKKEGIICLGINGADREFSGIIWIDEGRAEAEARLLASEYAENADYAGCWIEPRNFFGGIFFPPVIIK